MGKFDVFYIDPPWMFETRSEKGKGRSPENHYPVLTIDEIAGLRVGDLAKDNAALFLWVTFPVLYLAKNVFESWGFGYRTQAFTWAKTTPLAFVKLFSVFSDFVKGEIGSKDVADYFINGFWHFGTGYYTRANAEVCLLCVRGRMPVSDRGVRSLVISPVGRHSEKPKSIYRDIEKLYPDRKYIEIFARERRDGWTSLGNEIDGKDIRESIGELIHEKESERVI